MATSISIKIEINYLTSFEGGSKILYHIEGFLLKQEIIIFSFETCHMSFPHWLVETHLKLRWKLYSNTTLSTTISMVNTIWNTTQEISTFFQCNYKQHYFKTPHNVEIMLEAIVNAVDNVVMVASKAHI